MTPLLFLKKYFFLMVFTSTLCFTFKNNLLYANTSLNWEPVKQQDGIQVERRKVPDSPMHEFRGRGIVNAPISRILAIFADTNHAHEWMSGLIEQRILKGNIAADISDRESAIDLYNRISLGVGFSDRDVVVWIRLKADATNKQVWALFDSIDGPQYPSHDHIVRMPFLHGHWLFKPTQDGTATITEYQVHANPGSWLPDWIINYAARDIPYQTILGLQKQVQRRQYPAFEKMIALSETYQAIMKP